MRATMSTKWSPTPLCRSKNSLRGLGEKPFFIAKGGRAAKNTKMKSWKITRPDLRTTPIHASGYRRRGRATVCFQNNVHRLTRLSAPHACKERCKRNRWLVVLECKTKEREIINTRLLDARRGLELSLPPTSTPHAAWHRTASMAAPLRLDRRACGWARALSQRQARPLPWPKAALASIPSCLHCR